MAVATVAQVGKRVVWAIGARLSNGTYSLSTADDDRFDDSQIKDAIVETESELVRDLCESRHPMRSSFLGLSAAITHGTVVPVHIGQIESIMIEPYTAAGYILTGIKTTTTNIDLWRTNAGNRFDAIDHDQSGSLLAGYFDMDGNTLYFTGLNAKANICTYVPDFTTWVLTIDNQFTDALVAGAITKLNQLGLPTDVLQSNASIYSQERQMIRQGMLSAPSIEVEQAIG